MPENLYQMLGVAAPLVAVLMVLLKQATDERKEMTAHFLAALQTTVEQSNESRLRTANELAQLTVVLRDHQRDSADEHERIVDAIGKVGVSRGNTSG